MNKSILLAAAAVATLLTGATSFTPPAEAGMGIRVGFGFPMGNFVARPSRGSYANSYSSGKSCSKKRQPSYAARSRPAPRQEVARHETKRYKAKETSVASVQNERHSTPKKSRSVERADREDSSSTEVGEEIETSSTSTGSTALIQNDSRTSDPTTVEVPADLPAEPDKVAALAPATEAVTEQPTVTETEAVTETPAVAETPAPVTPAEATPAETKPVETPQVENQPKSKKSKTAKKEDCAKYIPAIGVTISVGC